MLWPLTFTNNSSKIPILQLYASQYKLYSAKETMTELSKRWALPFSSQYSVLLKSQLEHRIKWKQRIENQTKLSLFRLVVFRRTSPDGQHRNQIDYILCSQRWRSSIQSTKTRPGADYGSDHELLIAKFRLKLKKVGKTTRPFRYDLKIIKSLMIIQWKWEIDLRD